MKASLTMVSLLLLAACSLPDPRRASGDDSKIPAWLAESETYGFAVGLEEVNGTAWKFITHTPHDEEFLREAKRRGIRAFPYMSFYQAWLMQTAWDVRLSDHPDWILVGQSGKWAPTGFWESEDAKNMYCTCPNVHGYTDALLGYLEMLMKRGASGIFLDNVHPNRECYGEQFGKHKHLFPTQVEAFADLMRRARALIKKYDPEGALLINSADPASLPPEFWPYADSEMSESFICTWVSEKRWGEWLKSWNGIDKKVPAGKQVCCLSYLGHNKQQSVKEDAFFCYASARLMNFIWGTGYDRNIVKDDSAIRKLFSIRLGRPETVEKEREGVHYRQFQFGLVAVNPTDMEKRLVVADPIPTHRLRDIYNDVDLVVEKGSVAVALPPQSGRVYLYKPAADEGGLAKESHTLVVKTQPGLGKTSFELDGVPMMTYAGHWTTEYVKGESYGTFVARFDKPGWHTLKIVDDIKKEMLVANTYEDAYAINETKMPGATAERRDPARLGKLMDPSNPAKFYDGKPYRFTGWDGAATSSEKTVKIYVDGEKTIVALFQRD